MGPETNRIQEGSFTEPSSGPSLPLTEDMMASLELSEVVVGSIDMVRLIEEVGHAVLSPRQTDSTEKRWSPGRQAGFITPSSYMTFI